MTSITVRNLEDEVKQRIRIRAAQNGHSMEEEVREILRHAVAAPATPQNLGEIIHTRFVAMGGIELELPPRDPMRELPSF